ncbi:polysaccharide biosynthesis/export family protein [Methylocystis echinoides]|uniref:polysaccharide biosynthesis/export family protein n=1 Tax=Methylocystis echinoides TaxID=29468 RepID=UPI00341AC8B0
MPRPEAPKRIAATRLLLPVAVLASAFLSACAAPGDYRPELYAASTAEAYTLSAGDRLRVIVFGQDSLSNAYAVDGAGRIAMPLIGSVPAQGRTVPEVEREIAARLRDGYVREPRVSVEVEAFRPFFVLGEVTNAGQFPFVEGMTVRTAIAIAGGFGPRGYQGGVDLTRIVDGVPVTGRVPLDAPVRPGDTLTVRERIF